MAVTLFVGADVAVDVPLVSPLDKIVHFTYYGIMALLLAHAVGRRWLWVPVLLVPLIGAADEFHQSMVVGRDASIWDWVADGLGTMVFVFGYWKWGNKK